MRDTLLQTLPDAAPPVEDGAHLLGRMLHRFRNSLTSVRGYAELLGGDEVPAERRRQWAGRIVDQIERIEDLQTRLDAGARGAGATGEHSLGMILRAAVERSRSRASEAVAAIDVRLRGGDVMVHGDGESLTEALAALLDNAIEATLDAGGTRVDASLTSDDEGWTLRIVDTGDGMSPAISERAGSAFFSRKPGHLGLGLYLSRSILLRHDLDLEIANASDAGAVVTIRGRRLPSYL